MKYFILSFAFILGTASVLIGQDTAGKLSPKQLLEAFEGSLESQDAEAKKRALDAMGAARDKESPTNVQFSEGLKALYPELEDAVNLSTEGDGRKGLQALYKLTRSKDQFLAAESAYIMARTMFSQQRYEEALPFLQSLRQNLQPYTMRHGDVLYYQGIAEANSLEKEAAIVTLSMFLEDYPEASDRLKISAQATLDGISGVMDGSIEDIADHMDFSHRRLSVEDPGEQTQEVQGKVVAMLDDIIKAAEEQQQQQQQQQQQAGGGGQGQQQQQGKQPGAGEGQTAGGNASEQSGPKKVRRIEGAAKSDWDDLRKRDRENDTLSGLKSKFPPRYSELVEQYFSDLQQGESDDDETTEPDLQP